MSEAAATITALSKDFDAHIVQIKPGSAKKPATKYVSHGSVTKRLNAVCPGWSSRVTQMHTLVDQRGMLQCLGVTLELTIPGVGSREEFGAASTPRDFGTDAKNAMSDALKRCAMRFGVAIDLWEDMDEYDEDATPSPELGTALLEIIRNDLADPKERKRALHNYYASASTIAGLNQRVEKVKQSGLPGDELTAAYRWHHDRLSQGFVPADTRLLAPAGVAG